MPAFVMLFNWTGQGIQNYKLMPDRVEAAIEAFKEKGVTVKDWYMLMGRYDTIFICDAPDDETMAKAALELGALGNVRSETLRAFSLEESRKLIGT